MEALVGLVIAAAVLLALPLLLLAAVCWLVFQIVLLPFRLLAFAFKVLAGAGVLVLKLVGAAVGLLGVVLAVVLLPLLPFVILGGVLWLFFRWVRPGRALAVS